MSEELTNGEAIIAQFDAIVEPWKKDLVKFFDKGMSKPGSRVRKGSMDITKFLKQLRLDVSEVKKQRKEEKAA